MNSELTALKAKLRFWTLFLGVFQITVGCLIGLLPPDAVPYFRGILSAHLEFTANGVMMIAFAFLLNEMHLNHLGLRSWFVTLQIGTWSNGLSAVVAAFSGSTSKLTPIMNQQSPPPAGMNNPISMGLLMLCAVTIIIAFFITLYGLIRKYRSNNELHMDTVL